MALSLLENGHSVKSSNWEGKTPLHLAIIQNEPLLVEFLVKLNASNEVKDIYDHIPSDYINPLKPDFEILEEILGINHRDGIYILTIERNQETEGHSSGFNVTSMADDTSVFEN